MAEGCNFGHASFLFFRSKKQQRGRKETRLIREGRRIRKPLPLKQKRRENVDKKPFLEAKPSLVKEIRKIQGESWRLLPCDSNLNSSHSNRLSASSTEMEGGGRKEMEDIFWILYILSSFIFLFPF